MRMFGRHSKSRAVAGSDGPQPGWVGDLSGAFADLGTFLPLVIALLVLGDVDPTGLLIGFGLFAIATGLIYRLPIPVQPMKLVAALAVAGGLSADAMVSSGMLLGLALLLLGGSGLIGRMRKLVPRTVLAGLQLALGLHLLAASVDLGKEGFEQAVLALGMFLLLLMSPLRSIASIFLVVVGIIWSLLGVWTDLPAGTGLPVGTGLPSLTPALHLPVISLPAWDAFSEAAISAFWPQLALTLANAVLLTSVLAAGYFPDARPGTSAKRLALSSGALNLLLAPIGAMPMCHGAGGLAAQYHQGARSGLAPAIFGAACLALGLLAGPLAVDLLILVPLPVVAVLLGYAGFQLLISGHVTHASWTCRAVIALTALVSFGVNVAVGLAAGLMIELIRSTIANLRQPTT